MTKKEIESQQDPDKEIVKLYNINIKNLLKLSKKASIIETDNNELFFIKKIDRILEKKYQYLNEIGAYNVLFPIKNKNNELVTKINDEYIFVKEYI